MNPNDFTPKNAGKFDCKLCDFKCCKESDYIRHISTPKHINRINPNDNAQNNTELKKYKCICGKEYKHHSSLCNHKKSCNNEEKHNEEKKNEEKHKEEKKNEEKGEDEEEIIHNNIIMEIMKQNQYFKEMILEKSPVDSNELLVLELLKQNQEFKELMVEQNKYMMEQGKQMIDLAKSVGHNTTNNNNTTNNTKFNMQFFLNETCKNAMSITEFVDSLELTFEDLENVGRVGYAEGISQIFIKGIRATEVCKRPIHCSDIKRVVMFINDINGWEKDSNSNEKIIRLIKQIAKKNMKQASVWISQHQHIVHGHGSIEQTQYNTMIGECFGGGTAEEDTKNYNKIIKRIAPEIYIRGNVKE